MVLKEPVITSTAETYGGYSSLGNVVHATMRMKVNSSIPAWTLSIGVPAPAQGAFRVMDSKGSAEFQINDNGIFQNAVTLEPGDYTVFAIYIK